jgi:large subunit ribosomal protein L21
MFAVVRTGGKQYRVAAGDKIVVEKLSGEAGDAVSLNDVLFASEGDAKGLTVAAEIIAQAKADKVTIFKKKRRHNYRRHAGHRQQHTILKIVSVGAAKKAAPKKEAAAVETAAATEAKPAKKPAAKKAAAAPAAE